MMSLHFMHDGSHGHMVMMMNDSLRLRDDRLAPVYWYLFTPR